MFVSIIPRNPINYLKMKSDKISRVCSVVVLPDELVDEWWAAGALSVNVLLADDQLIHVRNELHRLAHDEQDGDRNLDIEKLCHLQVILVSFYCYSFV